MSDSIFTRVALMSGCIALIACGGGGGSSASPVATVSSTPPPGGSVSVNFSASAQTVVRGDTVTLTWTSSNANSCQASDAWSGNRTLSGSEVITIANSNQSFTLTCSAGSNQQAVAIGIAGASRVTVSWNAPTTNSDNSPLSDLAGYTVWHGQASRNYSQSENVNSSAQTNHAINLLSGDHYIAITAFNALGIDSDFSNEISVTID